MSWYVAFALGRQEAKAAASLKEAGFDAYYPQLTRLERIGRQKKREPVKRPLIDGYLFVRVLNGDFRKAEAVNGVQALLRSVNQDGDRRPSEIPETLVESYQQAEIAGAFDQRFKIGARGRVTDGPWKDHVAEIVEIDGASRVKVFLALFGKMNKVTLDVSALEPA